MKSAEKFCIKVRSENYTIETSNKNDNAIMEYCISTNCNYIMTIFRNEDESWSAAKDVTIMDEELVNEIGAAIELREA